MSRRRRRPTPPVHSDRIVRPSSPDDAVAARQGRRGEPGGAPHLDRLTLGTVHDVQLNVTRRGSGPPIVMIHGLGMSATTWDAVAERLADRHDVLAVDLPGHGESPSPEDPAAYTRDAALADLDDVLATLDELPVLVGHSLGGYLALAHAATRPDASRGIVVLNTGPGFRDPEKREGLERHARGVTLIVSGCPNVSPG